MNKKLQILNNKIIKCNKCKRLVNFRKKILKNKRKKYINQKYWGKPITGFGDQKGKILFVGLAPAAHGGNRTGRVFTGDRSADFLFECLFRANLCNQPHSINRKDGLKLYNIYLTTALKCVPPGDKPKPEELKKCSFFFKKEIHFLSSVKTILALGKIAFDTYLGLYKEKYKLKSKDFKFSHGAKFLLPDNKILIGSYHPSPRNVNTGRIDHKKMVNLLQNVKLTLSDD